MSATVAFEPAKYLSRVSGADYLEVKWRLVWLRDRHPDASIETTLVSHEDNIAVFLARVAIPGGGSSTGWGSESAGDFRDYLEKAETKAIGRALAALGFGTQFCPDHEFGAASGRIVDAPVKVSRFPQNRPVSDRHPDAHVAAAPEQAATQRQLRYLQAVAREAGIDAASLDELAMSDFGVLANDLNRRDASTLIDNIQTRRTDVPLAS